MSRRIAAAVLSLCIGTATAEGIITRPSPYSVEETSERLVSALEQRGLTVVGRIDHAAAAAKQGAKLPASQLVLFSDPQVAADLLRCQPTIGLELPQKALVWEDAAGKVRLSYPDPEAMVVRHGIGDCGESVTRLQAALKDTAFAATSEEPATLSASGPQPPDGNASTDYRDRQ